MLSFGIDNLIFWIFSITFNNKIEAKMSAAKLIKDISWIPKPKLYCSYSVVNWWLALPMKNTAKDNI